MMFRLILVTCMTSSVLSLPLHRLFRRGIVKRFGNENYEYMVNILADEMVNHYGGDTLTEQQTGIQLQEHGINEDTATQLANLFLTCCDNNTDNRLNSPELQQAMHEFSFLIFP